MLMVVLGCLKVDATSEMVTQEKLCKNTKDLKLFGMFTKGFGDISLTNSSEVVTYNCTGNPFRCTFSLNLVNVCETQGLLPFVTHSNFEDKGASRVSLNNHPIDKHSFSLSNASINSASILKMKNQLVYEIDDSEQFTFNAELGLCCDSMCPDGYFHVQNQPVCYKIVLEKKSWIEALEHCRNDASRGRLALLDLERAKALGDKFRNNIEVQSALHDYTKSLYVGLKKNYGDCGNTKYSFNTNDEQLSVNKAWWHEKLNSETCSPQIETCASFEFLKSTGELEWKETNCADKHPFVCEFPLHVGL